MAMKKRRTGYLVTFPQQLTKKQVEALKKALRCAVVCVDPERIQPGDVSVQNKINDLGPSQDS